MQEGQLNLFDYQERIGARLSTIRDILVAYIGEQQRITRRSKVPELALWPTYELFKLGMTPEQVSRSLQSKYPTDFEKPPLGDILTLTLRTAQEEYLNSSHITEERLPNNQLGQNRN